MYIIDRFEGDWAVIETENRQTFNLPREILPAGTREGDVLAISVAVNQVATKERRNHASKLLQNFFNE